MAARQIRLFKGNGVIDVSEVEGRAAEDGIVAKLLFVRAIRIEGSRIEIVEAPKKDNVVESSIQRSITLDKSIHDIDMGTTENQGHFRLVFVGLD